MTKDKNTKEEELDYPYISMMSDYGFKKTFGNEKNTLFLRKAIQLLIKSKVAIREVSFTRNEVSALTKTSRGGVYDISCVNEQGDVFIVEMQYLDFKNFIQRCKFYGFHSFNKMVRRGKYHFDDLKKIYIISILADQAFETKEYHHISNIRNQKGQKLDDQLTFVFLELGKWDKTLDEIESDLDKLIYTMKMTEAIKNNEPYQLPYFLTEEWLDSAIQELEASNMTPDERMEYEMMLARNGSMIAALNEAVEKRVKEALEKEKALTQQKIEEEKALTQQKIEEEKALAEQKVEAEKALAEQKVEAEKALAEQKAEEERILAQQKIEEERILAQQKAEEEKILTTKNLLRLDVLTIEQIAAVVDLSVEEIKSIQAELK